MRTVLIKIGGNAVGKSSAAFVRFVRREIKKSGVVVVHGGGPDVNAWLIKAGLTPRFVAGVRYTDAATLAAAVAVLAGKVNKSVVSLLARAGIPAAGISAADGAIAVCSRVAKLGYVGKPVKINTLLVDKISAAGFVPVISSIGADKRGNLLNINADVLADSLSRALRASRLVYVTDVAGVLDGRGGVIKKITPRTAAALVKKGIITGGMIPKIRSALASVSSGVGEVVITNLKSGGTTIAPR